MKTPRVIRKDRKQGHRFSSTQKVGLLKSLGVSCGLVFFLFLPTLSYAEVTPPKNLWKGLIAEACSEGEIGMRAVCHVYKNRLKKGLSLGCVGLKRRDLDEFVKQQGKSIESMAKSIVEEVFRENTEDITGGATHYENVEAFGTPYWAKKMKVVCKIKSHTFYKRLTKGE